MTYTLWTREGPKATRYTHGNSVWCWAEMRWSPGEKTRELSRKAEHWNAKLVQALKALGDTKAFSTSGSKCTPCLNKTSISAGSVASLGPPRRHSGGRKGFPGSGGLLPITKKETAGTWSGCLVRKEKSIGGWQMGWEGSVHWDSDMSGPKVKLRHSGRRGKHDRPHTAVKGSLVSLGETRLKGMLSQQGTDR